MAVSISRTRHAYEARDASQWNSVGAFAAAQTAIVSLLAAFCLWALGTQPLSAESSWTDDGTVQQQLDAGQIPVHFAFESNESSMRVSAAVDIHATPEAIWRVLTDCEHAASFIPGVKRCHRIESAPDGSWELIEQEAKYSWLMPAVTCRIRADFKRPRRIDFKRVSGDLKEERGTWLLATAPAPSSTTHADSTIVEYELYVDPGFWIPRVLLRHSLRSELPAALTALRNRVENETRQPDSR